MKSILAVFMASVMALASVGCGTTTSNLITALNAVSDAASVAVVVTQALVATGAVSQADANLVSTYATGVATAVNTSTTELNSKDSNAEKIAVITTAFAEVAAPALGPNSATIEAAIQAVVSTISIFIAQLNSSTVVTAAKLVPHAPIVLNSADKAMIKKIKAKTALTLAAAVSLKK